MPPSALLEAIHSVRRRVRALAAIYGAGIVATLTILTLLAVALADYLLNLPAAPRMLIASCAVGVLVYALIDQLLRPLMADLSVTDVAGRLEQSFPQFGDRLRSTVDFMRGSVPGSPAMQRRVVEQASTLAEHLDLRHAVIAKPAYLSASAAVTAIILLGLLCFALPQYAQIAVARFTSPLTLHPWPKRVQIELIDRPGVRLPVGQHVDLHMRLARGDSVSRTASVMYQFGNGSQQRELMKRNSDGSYSASLDTHLDAADATGLLKVTIEAGDDQVSLAPIAIVPRLAISQVIAQITPPPYVSNRVEQSVNLAAAPAVVAEGSNLSVRITFNKALAASGEVQLIPTAADVKAPAVTWTRPDATSAVASWAPRQSLRFHLRATDADAFSNNALEEYELNVRPDAPPSIQIESPRRNEERTVESIVPLTGLAEDDYGLSSIALVVERLTDQKRWEVPLLMEAKASGGANLSAAESSTDRQRLRVEYEWKLSDLKDADLKPGDSLEYHLEAKDNFVLGDQTHPPVASGRLRIVVISQDDLTSRVSDELRLFKQQLSAVRANQDRNRQETSSLLDDTRKKPRLDTADMTTLDRLTDQQAAAAAQTKQLADNVAGMNRRLAENRSKSQELNDLTRELAQQLQRAAESPMKDASQQLAAAKQSAEAFDARNRSLETAGRQQEQASDQLQQAIDRMANIGSLSTAIDNLQKLLDAQQQVSQQTADAGNGNLGKTPEQMSDAERAKLQQAADAQSKLAEQTAKALEDMQKLAEQMAKSDPAAADALHKAASTGQQQQVSQNQIKAANSARQNQQSQAQATQKQVELGLQQMLGNLREAEQHRLAELQKQLEELQGQIVILVRRQAGHNLDDLTLQGSAALKKIGAAVLASLTVQSERAAPASAAALPTLTSGQEQTEQNARDIVKLAEKGDDGSETASNLTRAAGKMERAIVALKDSKLDAAYDPSQVEALAALNQAKKIVDDQKAKLDAKLDDQSAAAVRDQFVKIREKQSKLNEQTISIDQTRRADGALSRVSTVKLGQLPAEEAQLIDQISKLDDALSAAGSTVFIWANKDIARQMSAVREHLSNRQSGLPVQVEQERVVDELDAMIRNLVTKSKESKFASDSAAGGGSKGKPANPGPKLPSEAELRLLQDFQRSINSATKLLDTPQKDKPAILNLSNQQAEYRSLLDQLLQKASHGQSKLPPEPDNKDALPEEAKAEQIENNELDQDLLAGVASDQKNEAESNLIGDRMARSRQRLGLNTDPGKVTQAIQGKIITDFDYLIDQARQQESESRHAPSKDGQQMGEPQQQPQMAQDQGKQQHAENSKAPASASLPPGKGGHAAEDLSADIRQSAAEWGAIAPRLRDAAVDSAGENVVESYRKLVEEYYRSVARQGAGQQQ